MKRSFVLLVLILSLLYKNSFAQNMPENLVKNFFSNYENLGTDQALTYIFSTNKWLDNSSGQIDNLKTKLNNATNLLGSYYGYELISTKKVGNSIVLYTYLVKYERQPLKFSFLLYKTNENWRLQNFLFDDSIEEELKETSK